MNLQSRSTRFFARVVGTLVLASSAVAFLSSAADAAPLSARSYYVSDFNLSWAYDRGCAAGNADEEQAGTQTRYVVLDFGSTYQQADGDWYVSFGGADRPLWRARNMVEEWAKGYYVCVGQDLESVAYVGLGTNNSGGDVTSAAGEALAMSAKNAVEDLQSEPVHYYNQGRPVGADDFEDWGQGSSLNNQSRDWMSGYNGVAGRPLVLNYGAAGGCPSTAVPSPSSCNVGLNAETIWRVSWSGVAYPLPEVYATTGTNAKQWRYLSKYSIVEKNNAKFDFRGVLAQSGACSQSGGCPGADNSPSDAWDQLTNQLNQDPAIDDGVGHPSNFWYQ